MGAFAGAAAVWSPLEMWTRTYEVDAFPSASASYMAVATGGLASGVLATLCDSMSQGGDYRLFLFVSNIFMYLAVGNLLWCCALPEVW